MKLYIVSCMPHHSNHFIAGAYVTRAAAAAAAAAAAVATEMSGEGLPAAQVFEVDIEGAVALDFGGGNKPAVYPLTCEGILALACDQLNDGYQNVSAPPIGARIVDHAAA